LLILYKFVIKGVISMNLKDFCADKKLGTVMNITKLTGGLMHKMFKVETDKGTYAIKILNPEVMSRSDAYNNFIISETISNLAKNNGIVVSSALPINGNYLTKYDDMYYMVFAFVKGKTLTDTEITTEHCQKIGQILARIHSLDYTQIGLKPQKEEYKQLYDWDEYINNPNFVKMSYQNAYLKNYQKYNSLLKRANERFNESNLEISICHNDMDPKNVMWDGLNPIIIDWEAAGLSNPYTELLEDALCWSGFLSNQFDEEKFTAIIAEYIKTRPIKHHRYNIICGNLVGRFEWLKYNLERSLGICSNDLEERKLAENEVSKTIAEINRYVELIGKMYEILCNLTKEANHDYDDIIEKIIEQNSLLKNQKYTFVAAGFTNTIYRVNNYIVKICTDLDNENNFQNEIEFYVNHKHNPYIPQMYFSDTTKEVVPYYYEILERVEGQTLYEVWYKLSPPERINIVKSIITIMKSFHNDKVHVIDFKKYVKDKISNLLKETNVNEELFTALLDKCNVYFEENKLGLVHKDLHFDNFIYNNGQLTLLDFERCIVGAIDYDFRILSRYKETPWLWANEKTDMLTVESDYQDLMDMFIDNYEALRNIPYLSERLKVYQIIDLLNGYRKHQDKFRLEKARGKVRELLK